MSVDLRTFSAAQGVALTRPLLVVGIDAPFALIEASGFQPVTIFAQPGPTPRVDAAMGGKGLSVRGKSLLEQMLAATGPILITRADAEQLQIFAVLRELARLGEANPPPVHLFDLRHSDRTAVVAYNTTRRAELSDWLVAIGGDRPSDVGVALAEAQRSAIAGQLDDVRQSLTGVEAFAVAQAGAVLPRDDFAKRLQNLLADPPHRPPSKVRIVLAGTLPESVAALETIEATGALIVGETWPTVFDADQQRKPLPDRSPDEVAAGVAAMAAAAGATHVVHLSIEADEAAPWDIAAIARALPRDLKFGSFRTGAHFANAIARFVRDEPEPIPAPRPVTVGAKQTRPVESTRSRKSLASIAEFSIYQREWFAGVRCRVADGAPFAVVNANAPQEILRALDIPFVVNQWWASIVAAKQQSRRYMGLLKEHGYPTHVEPYSAQALAAAFDDDADNAPWGGLPQPDFVHAITSSDPTGKIFLELAGATGADPFIYERTVDPRWNIATDWWDDLPDRWDEALEPARIDLLTAELTEVIARIEAQTGHRFDQDRFIAVMDLVNEQEDYYRRTRALVAAARRAPIGIVDSMPATMVPQWHRGTVWARDAAKAFYDEVAERVANGAAICPDERVRLMWVGRGLWSDMAFVQQWEESHGAIFVWSMYLALAADGYIRRYDRGRDPLRALAARFLTMGDELRMPSWGAPWHVHEAVTHRVDGAVALADADPFTVRALERAGIPVLALDVDNFGGGDGDLATRRITAFIEGPAEAKAAARRMAEQ